VTEDFALKILLPGMSAAGIRGAVTA